MAIPGGITFLSFHVSEFLGGWGRVGRATLLLGSLEERSAVVAVPDPIAQKLCNPWPLLTITSSTLSDQFDKYRRLV